MVAACSSPHCVSWHQRPRALCGVLPSPPCYACGSGAWRPHAESALHFVLGPTSPSLFPLTRYVLALLVSGCLSLFCPFPLLSFLSPLSVLCLASLSSLLLVVFLVTKLGLLLRNTGELQWPEPQELMREYTFTSLDWTSWLYLLARRQELVCVEFLPPRRLRSFPILLRTL